MFFICYYDSDEMMLNVFDGVNVIRYENVENCVLGSNFFKQTLLKVLSFFISPLGIYPAIIMLN